MQDGGMAEVTTNFIADNIFAQCDDEDNIYRVFDEIIDCQRKRDKDRDDRNRKKKSNRSDKYVYIQVRWKDGSDSWVPLWAMKESYPLETAEFAVAARGAAASQFRQPTYTRYASI